MVAGNMIYIFEIGERFFFGGGDLLFTIYRIILAENQINNKQVKLLPFSALCNYSRYFLYNLGYTD